MKNKKVNIFLGGTCNGSLWRNKLTPSLESVGITFYNPVVEDWSEEDAERERFHREHSDICLYCITPKMTGFVSIAEVVDDSNKRPDKTALVISKKDGDVQFGNHDLKGFEYLRKIIIENGAMVFEDLGYFVYFANKKFGKQ